MTKKKTLAELKALCEAATPGPWRIEEVGGYYYFRCPDEHSMGDKRKENAQFIAAARSEMPRLIERVRELEEEIKFHKENLRIHVKEFNQEIARLKEIK